MWKCGLSFLVLLVAAAIPVVHAVEIVIGESPEGVERDAAGKIKPAPLPAGALGQSGPEESLDRLAISPDGRTAATSGRDDGKIRLWKTGNTASLIATIDAHNGGCFGATFCLDNQTFISCGGDQVLKQWSIATQKEVRRFEGHMGEVRCVVCSPDGLHVASSDNAGTIRIWSLKSGRQVRMLTGHKIPQWAIEMEQGRSPLAAIDALAWSPDGRELISEADDATARLWSATTGHTIREILDHDGTTACLAFTPDGISGLSTRGWRYSGFGSAMRLWDVRSGAIENTYLGHTADLRCLAISPDGGTILSGGDDKTIRQWDVESGVELRRFWLLSLPSGVGFSPDSSRGYSISAREGLVTWNLTAPPLTQNFLRKPSIADAWTKLGSKDYDTRGAAFAFFAHDMQPSESAAAIGKLLTQPAPAESRQRMENLVAQLDDDSFANRCRAEEALAHGGDAAREALVAALSHRSAEVRMRAALIIAGMGGREDIREVLAIEILGTLKVPESTAELKRIGREGSRTLARRAQRIILRDGPQ